MMQLAAILEDRPSERDHHRGPRADGAAVITSLLEARGTSYEVPAAPELVPVLVLRVVIPGAPGDSGEVDRGLERSLDLAQSAEALPSLVLWARPDVVGPHSRATAHFELLSGTGGRADGGRADGGRPDGGRPDGGRAASIAPLRPVNDLSEKEIRVLRYLPTNLSAPDIARELYVSLNTVKTHLRHLYAKLGVHRRREAVERARALGILGSASATY